MGLAQTIFNRERHAECIGSWTGRLNNAEIGRHHDPGDFVGSSATAVSFTDSFQEIVGGLLGLAMTKCTQGRVGGQNSKLLGRRYPVIIGIVKAVLVESG